MNPKGHFKLTLHNEDLRFKNADYEAAVARGELDDLLIDVGVQEEHEADNLLFDTWLTFLFYRSGWSGCPTPPLNYEQSAGAGPGIWCIYLATYDPEPGYQDDRDCGHWAEFYSLGYAANGGTSTHGTKRFYNDQSHPFEVWCDPTGREQIFFRNRWFYYPYQGYSNDIRGVAIVWCEDVTTTSGSDRSKRWMGRIRFKDANGEPVRINKTAYQAMSLEYTFSMLTV